MAPPKTMAISQQHQQSSLIGQPTGDMKQNTVKPRKRKGKQQQQQQHQSQEQQPRADQVQKAAIEQLPASAKQIVVSQQQVFKAGVFETNHPSELPKKQANVASAASPLVVPSERTTVSSSSSNNNTNSNKSHNKPRDSAPQPQKQDSSSTNGGSGGAVKRVVQAASETTSVIAAKHKQQIVAEEADDIDAGIELDGSSNSGSSVKDIGEDQKSASVSPVMAQTGSESIDLSAATKQTAEVAPIEKLSGSVCTAAKLLTTTTTTTTTKTTNDESQKVKKFSSVATKQQLAANQQVIDADEQQLQQRLQNKQKRLVSQDSGASLDDSSSALENDKQPGVKKTQTATDATNQVRCETTKLKPRRFSSQSSQESQDSSSCKVCGQHVYQMEKMLAEKSIYHKRCFRCHQCKIQLRVDNYSSHEGQVYCKAHHRQIFQPQVKLDNGDDVDIVAKSTSKIVDDYLLHRGRLSELSFSFLQPKPQELLKRQMIICENEPAELPKDVVRSDTKLDDGIGQLNLNLNNILEKFERGTASGEESQPTSAGIVIEKPSFNIKQTLMAFESKTNDNEDSSTKRCERSTEKPIVKKLTNINGFLNRQSSQENEVVPSPARQLPVKRSESLMMRLKKYESRIAGEQVEDDLDSSDDDNDDENNNNNNSSGEPKIGKLGPDSNECISSNGHSSRVKRNSTETAKVGSINLSSLKSQWENGDINKRKNHDGVSNGEDFRIAASDNKIDGIMNQLTGEKSEELFRIRQQLARKKSGDSGSVRNIYENAIKEAQLQQKQQQSGLRRESSDLSALNGFSTTDIQQQLLKQTHSSPQKVATPQDKDHFQLNLSNRANKLKERFELGLINNSSRDDSDQSDGDEAPITKLEQIRQEKMEDLSIFTEGEIKAREARNLFQQIDRSVSAANGGASRQPAVSSRSLASVQDAMRNKLTNKMAAAKANNAQPQNHHQLDQQQQQPLENRPIRLTNNVRN